MLRLPPACTSPPTTVAVTVGFAYTVAVSTWTETRPPPLESVLESASVSDSASSVTLPEPVTLPLPNCAVTVGWLRAVAVDGSTEMRPMVVLATEAMALSTEDALTSMLLAPATPSVPVSPSGPTPVVVVPTSPFSWADVVPYTLGWPSGSRW